MRAKVQDSKENHTKEIKNLLKEKKEMMKDMEEEGSQKFSAKNCVHHL